MPGLWIRDDMAPQDLRRLTRSEKDTRVARRLLAIAGPPGRASAAGKARRVKVALPPFRVPLIPRSSLSSENEPTRRGMANLWRRGREASYRPPHKAMISTISPDAHSRTY